MEIRSFWKETFCLQGSVLPRVYIRVALFGLFALIICSIDIWGGWKTGITVTPFEFVGAILGLMLVLRTNSGYDRWYEARKLWGGIVNQSRNLTIQGLVYGPRDENWRQQFMKWTAAFPHVARHSLRGERNLDDVADLLGPDMPVVKAASNMPLIVAGKICMLLHEAVQSGGMDRFAFLQAEKERSQLIDHLGACERILKTPLASVYSVEIRRFLFAYLITLPLGMVDQIGIWTPVFIMVVAYPLLSLDQIGVDLQNPFSKLRLSHLPLDEISTAIEQNVLGVAQDLSASVPIPTVNNPKPPATTVASASDTAKSMAANQYFAPSHDPVTGARYPQYAGT